MGKKLEGNGLFESSRMMLPEHKAQFAAKQKEIRYRGRPVLDDQALEQYALLLLESTERQTDVAICVYDPIQDEIVEGKVVKIDFTLQRVKVACARETVSIRFADIVNVTRAQGD